MNAYNVGLTFWPRGECRERRKSGQGRERKDHVESETDEGFNRQMKKETDRGPQDFHAQFLTTNSVTL